MRAAIGPQQLLAVDLGVNLRGRERSVAELFLDDAQVGAVVEQVRGAGVAQFVRGARG